MIRTRIGGIAFLALVIGTGFSNAASITYMDSMTATGLLGSTPFTDTMIILTVTGDTSDVVDLGAGAYELLGLAASINITSLGTASLTDPVDVILSQHFSSAPDISDVSFLTDGTNNAVWGFEPIPSDYFADYSLVTSIGPITGVGFIADEFSTDQGRFTFSSGGATTFTATTEAVSPEPTTMALFIFGLSVLAAFKRRRSRFQAGF